jgi:2-amino-4-hydroxy-6-hydroxymethyldihydropteridine diphosphokinase
MVRAYLGIGGNIGDRLENMRSTVRRIGERYPIVSVSSIYETEPVGYLDQPAFLNAAVTVDAPDDPHVFFRNLLEVELALGRKRMFANAPRTIDIDLLLFGDRVIDDADLTVPHPRMHERAFVMVPLSEIAPDVVHPTLGKTIAELERSLPAANEGVERLAGPEWGERGPAQG